MSRKVRNLFFAGKTVQISSERVAFDKDGIGTIESDELAAEVVQLKGYEDPEIVEDGINEDDKDNNGQDGDDNGTNNGEGEGSNDGDDNGESQDGDGGDAADAGTPADNAQQTEPVQQPVVQQAPVRQPAAAVRRTPPKSNNK